AWAGASIRSCGNACEKGLSQVVDFGEPVANAVSAERGRNDNPRLTVDRKNVFGPLVEVERYMRNQIALVQHDEVRGPKHRRIFERLVGAFGGTGHYHSKPLAEIEERGTNQIADVLDEEQVTVTEIEMMQRVVDLMRIEMTAEPRLHLAGGGTCGADARAVAVGRLVAFNHQDAPGSAPLGDRCLQERGLSRTRRPHQVYREDFSPGEMSAVVFGFRRIRREQALVDIDGPHGRSTAAASITHRSPRSLEVSFHRRTGAPRQAVRSGGIGRSNRRSRKLCHNPRNGCDQR